MYHYLDRSTASLDATSAFLLWAMRHAAGALAVDRCVAATLGAGFARIGLSEALPHFAIAMAVLVRETNQPVAVMCPGCPRVAEHEALMLTLITAHDADSDARVRAAAGLLAATEAAADTLYRALRAVTAEVLAHGLMPAQPDGARR